MSGVLQGSIFRPVLINIFMNDTDSRINCTFSKSADDTKLSCATDTTEGWDATKRDSDKPEQCSHGSLMRFNNAKCKRC